MAADSAHRLAALNHRKPISCRAVYRRAVRRRSFRDSPTPAQWRRFAVRLAPTRQNRRKFGPLWAATGVKRRIGAALDTAGISEKGRLYFLLRSRMAVLAGAKGMIRILAMLFFLSFIALLQDLEASAVMPVSTRHYQPIPVTPTRSWLVVYPRCRRPPATPRRIR